jgi:hypothetical protein
MRPRASAIPVLYPDREKFLGQFGVNLCPTWKCRRDTRFHAANNLAIFKHFHVLSAWSRGPSLFPLLSASSFQDQGSSFKRGEDPFACRDVGKTEGSSVLSMSFRLTADERSIQRGYTARWSRAGMANAEQPHFRRVSRQ